MFAEESAAFMCHFCGLKNLFFLLDAVIEWKCLREKHIFLSFFNEGKVHMRGNEMLLLFRTK